MKYKIKNGLIVLMVLLTFCIVIAPAEAATDLKITSTNLNALQTEGTWKSYNSGELLVYGSAKDLSAPYQKNATVGSINALTVADYNGYYWGQCVSLAKALSQSTKTTSTWIKGRNVISSGNVPSGTVIATFNSTGKYTNTPGESHTAIFRDYHKLNGKIDGIMVWDQNWISPNVVGRHNITTGSKTESYATNYYVVQV